MKSYHKTEQGTIMAIADMKFNHLVNTLNLLERMSHVGGNVECLVQEDGKIEYDKGVYYEDEYLYRSGYIDYAKELVRRINGEVKNA